MIHLGLNPTLQFSLCPALGSTLSLCWGWGRVGEEVGRVLSLFSLSPEDLGTDNTTHPLFFSFKDLVLFV